MTDVETKLENITQRLSNIQCDLFHLVGENLNKGHLGRMGVCGGSEEVDKTDFLICEITNLIFEIEKIL